MPYTLLVEALENEDLAKLEKISGLTKEQAKKEIMSIVEETMTKEIAAYIKDKEAEANRAMREVSAGLLGKIEYRMKIFGETEEIARNKIQEIEDADPEVEDLLGTKDRKKDPEEEKKDGDE